MRLWIVYYPINDPGGIDTWIINLIAGLRLNGHTVDFSYAAMGKRMNVNPFKYTRMGKSVRSEDRLPATLISYGDDDGLDDYISRTRLYDAIIFAHSAPHNTKSYNDPDMRWLKLYYESHAPIITLFHDDRWKNNNPWAVEIAPYCEGILFAQNRFYGYGMDNDPFPMQDSMISWVSSPVASVVDMGLHDRHKTTHPRRIGTCLSQWHGLKNHKYLLPQLYDVTEFALHVYGAGRLQYYYQRKEDYWKNVIGYDAIADVHHNDYSPHCIMGYVPYSDIMDIYMCASFSVDASTQGQENMTILEPMCYGAVSVVPDDILTSSDYQLLTEDFLVTAPLCDLILVAKDVCDNYELYRAEREAGVEYVRQHHTLEGVAEYVALMIEAIIDGETGLFPEGLEKWAK